MPKQISDEHVALMMLPAAPANPDAITAGEWNAGTPLQCRIETFRATPIASDTVAGGEFCRAINSMVPTRSNFEASMTVYRYLTGAGLADSANDVAFAAVKEKGTTLHLAVRKGPKHDTMGQTGQEYSYFEVITDWPSDPTDWGGFLRSEVTLYVQRAALNKVIVGPNPPTLASISPTTGSDAGGTSVTLTGTLLTGATAVKFGAGDATAVTVVSATSVTCTTPAGAGVVDVSVSTPGGTATLTGAYTYAP